MKVSLLFEPFSIGIIHTNTLSQSFFLEWGDEKLEKFQNDPINVFKNTKNVNK